MDHKPVRRGMTSAKIVSHDDNSTVRGGDGRKDGRRFPKVVTFFHRRSALGLDRRTIGLDRRTPPLRPVAPLLAFQDATD